jgi:mannose-6-phosphate isomerase-like protein (cupin superfamily)
MPSDHTKQITPETLGEGVYDPLDFRVYSDEGASVVRMYHEDPDASIVVWNLEPGQENDIHTHEQNLHVFYVLEGSGIYVRGDEPPVAVDAGQCVIIPRGQIHGIRNTGTERLAYVAFSTYGPEGYVRKPAS